MLPAIHVWYIKFTNKFTVKINQVYIPCMDGMGLGLADQRVSNHVLAFRTFRGVVDATFVVSTFVWLYHGCLRCCPPTKLRIPACAIISSGERCRKVGKKGKVEPTRNSAQNLSHLSAAWWFQILFYFHPENWGRFPFWLIFFRWVETTNQSVNDFDTSVLYCEYLQSFEHRKAVVVIGDCHYTIHSKEPLSFFLQEIVVIGQRSPIGDGSVAPIPI